MHCTLCYSNNLFIFNWKNKSKKGLISYFKTSGITCLRKHVDANLLVVSKNIWKRRRNLEGQHVKKRANVFNSSICNFLFLLKNFKKMMWGKRNNFGRYYFSHSEKSFALIVCGKCLTKAFDLAFVPLSSIPFMNFFFTQCFVYFVEKTK
jgi:hypothetical protein